MDRGHFCSGLSPYIESENSGVEGLIRDGLEYVDNGTVAIRSPEHSSLLPSTGAAADP